MTTLDEGAVDALFAFAADEVAAGRSGCAQVAVAVGGDVRSASFGTGPETRFCLFSASKVLTSLVVGMLIVDGELDPDAPVARFIPEFTGQGKDQVLVRHVMLMQGGFPQAPMGPRDWPTSEGRRRRMASWRLDWDPGTQTEYHPMAAHWVLAELVETIVGRSNVAVVEERITGPAGVPRILGVPLDQQGPVAPVRIVGERPPDADLVAAFGRPDLVPMAVVTPEALLALNDPRVRAAGIPGGGGIATAADVARLYQWILAAVPPSLIGDVENRQINRTDGMPASRTLAGVVAGDDGYAALRWFPEVRPRAFGHHGAGGQLCWGDPDTGLSCCFVHDTMHQDPAVELARARRINSLATACARP